MYTEDAQDQLRAQLKDSTHSIDSKDDRSNSVEKRFEMWFKALSLQYRFELPLLGCFLGIELLDRIISIESANNRGISHLSCPQAFCDMSLIMDPQQKIKCQVVTNYSSAHIDSSGMISVGDKLLKSTAYQQQKFIFGHEIAHFICGHFDTSKKVRLFKAFLAPVLFISSALMVSKIIRYLVQKNKKFLQSKMFFFLSALGNGLHKIGCSSLINTCLLFYYYFKLARIDEKQADMVAVACDPLLAQAGISYFKGGHIPSIFLYLNPFVFLHCIKEQCGFTAHPS